MSDRAALVQALEACADALEAERAPVQAVSITINGKPVTPADGVGDSVVVNVGAGFRGVIIGRQIIKHV